MLNPVKGTADITLFSIPISYMLNTYLTDTYEDAWIVIMNRLSIVLAAEQLCYIIITEHDKVESRLSYEYFDSTSG